MPEDATGKPSQSVRARIEARRLGGGLGGRRGRLLMAFVDLRQAVQHLRVICILESARKYA